jgi:hypothetical protein
MVRVYACSVPADVIPLKAFWWRTLGEVISTTRVARNVELAVPILRKSAEPEKAVIGTAGIDTRPEALLKRAVFGCKWVAGSLVAMVVHSAPTTAVMLLSAIGDRTHTRGTAIKEAVSFPALVMQLAQAQRMVPVGAVWNGASDSLRAHRESIPPGVMRQAVSAALPLSILRGKAVAS